MRYEQCLGGAVALAIVSGGWRVPYQGGGKLARWLFFYNTLLTFFHLLILQVEVACFGKSFCCYAPVITVFILTPDIV